MTDDAAPAIRLRIYGMNRNPTSAQSLKGGAEGGFAPSFIIADIGKPHGFA